MLLASLSVRHGEGSHGVWAAQRMLARAWLYWSGALYSGSASSCAGLKAGQDEVRDMVFAEGLD